MKKILLSSFVFLALAACTSPEKKKNEPIVLEPGMSIADTTGLHSPAYVKPGSVDEKPLERVQEILGWYAKNRQDMVQQSSMVNTAAGKPYSVNFEATDKYLKQLEKSGQFSSEYISAQRMYFQQREEDFKANPQTQGTPRGFEKDFILPSAAFVQDLATLADAKATTQVVSGESAVIILEFPSKANINFNLVRREGKWVINLINSI